MSSNKSVPPVRKPKVSKKTDTSERAGLVITELRKVHPEARTALEFRSPLQLLIATILSAQCTDERVNLVTKDLFRKYRTAHDFAGASQKTLEAEIRSTGFFRAKTRNIIGCCKALVEQHGGNVPGTMEDLVRLPGVGRKTANVVLGSAFGKSEGIVVDTHVRRLTNRLGFTTFQDPEKIELDLMKIIPQTDWIEFPHLMIWHGRKVCQARTPKCQDCTIRSLCPSALPLK